MYGKRNLNANLCVGRVNLGLQVIKGDLFTSTLSQNWERQAFHLFPHYQFSSLYRIIPITIRTYYFSLHKAKNLSSFYLTLWTTDPFLVLCQRFPYTLPISLFHSLLNLPKPDSSLPLLLSICVAKSNDQFSALTILHIFNYFLFPQTLSFCWLQKANPFCSFLPTSLIIFGHLCLFSLFTTLLSSKTWSIQGYFGSLFFISCPLWFPLIFD